MSALGPISLSIADQVFCLISVLLLVLAAYLFGSLKGRDIAIEAMERHLEFLRSFATDMRDGIVEDIDRRAQATVEGRHGEAA